MKPLKAWYLFIISILFAVNIFAAEKIFYIAKKGDHLSIILDRLDIHPIHGKNGFWKKTVALNSFLQKSNGTEIFPGDKIYLSEELRDQIADAAEISNLGEILPRGSHAVVNVIPEVRPTIEIRSPEDSKKSPQKTRPDYYIVKRGDDLTAILDRLDMHPIHGKNGFWKKTVALNPFLQAKNGTALNPGDKIFLPTAIRPAPQPVPTPEQAALESAKVEDSKQEAPKVEASQIEVPKIEVIMNLNPKFGLGTEASSEAAVSKFNMMDRIYYIVRRGEYLALIFEKLNIHPFDGPSGYWKKTVALNPFMKPQNGSLIYPGDKIYLPIELLQRIERVAHVANSGQVFLSERERLPAEETLQPTEAHSATAAEDDPPAREKSNAHPPEPKKLIVPALPIGPRDYGDSSIFSLMPTTKYLRIEGFDSTSNSKSTLLSNLGTGLDLSWAQVWDRDLETRLTFGAIRLSVNESATKTIEQRSQDLLHFEFGSKFKITERTRIDLVLGSEEELIYRATSMSTIKVEKIQAPLILIGLDHDIKTLKHLSFGGGLYYQYLLPYRNDLYDGKAASGWAGKLHMKHSSKQIEVFGDFNYSSYQRKIDPLTITYTDIGINFGIGWFWDRDEP